MPCFVQHVSFVLLDAYLLSLIGGAVVRALIESKSPISILAVTRNTTSPSAKKLGSQPNVSVVQGDLNDCPGIFKAAGPDIWGVFSVQVPAVGFTANHGEDGQEVSQGKALVDAAVASGVKHFVYTSADRGGVRKSDSDPTNIPHFRTKYVIEKYLEERAQASGMTWTILRPVAFMENLMPNFFGKGFAAMWAQVGEKPVQLIATRDVGYFGAMAFARPEEYRNRALSLAGDELNQAEASRIFQEEMGRPMPITFGFVGSLLQTMVKELGIMFKWFKDAGFAADIKQCRKEYPGMQDFRTWLRESGMWEK